MFPDCIHCLLSRCCDRFRADTDIWLPWLTPSPPYLVLVPEKGTIQFDPTDRPQSAPGSKLAVLTGTSLTHKVGIEKSVVAAHPSDV